MILSKYTKLNRALSFSHIKPIKRERERERKKKDGTKGNRIKLTKVKTITTYYLDMTI